MSLLALQTRRDQLAGIVAKCDRTIQALQQETREEASIYARVVARQHRRGTNDLLAADAWTGGSPIAACLDADSDKRNHSIAAASAERDAAKRELRIVEEGIAAQSRNQELGLSPEPAATLPLSLPPSPTPRAPPPTSQAWAASMKALASSLAIDPRSRVDTAATVVSAAAAFRAGLSPHRRAAPRPPRLAPPPPPPQPAPATSVADTPPPPAATAVRSPASGATATPGSAWRRRLAELEAQDAEAARRAADLAAGRLPAAPRATVDVPPLVSPLDHHTGISSGGTPVSYPRRALPAAGSPSAHGDASNAATTIGNDTSTDDDSSCDGETAAPSVDVPLGTGLDTVWTATPHLPPPAPPRAPPRRGPQQALRSAFSPPQSGPPRGQLPRTTAATDAPPPSPTRGGTPTPPAKSRPPLRSQPSALLQARPWTVPPVEAPVARPQPEPAPPQKRPSLLQRLLCCGGSGPSPRAGESPTGRPLSSGGNVVNPVWSKTRRQ